MPLRVSKSESTYRRAAKARFDDVTKDLFEWHTVPFVHREDEKWHHDHDHDERGDTDIDR